jgi:hypothetical protein
MGVRTRLLHRWLPKGKAPLQDLFPDAKMPTPLSADYLLLVVEYRKREYLLEVERTKRAKWYQLPKAIRRVYQARRRHRLSAELLQGEIARASISD